MPVRRSAPALAGALRACCIPPGQGWMGKGARKRRQPGLGLLGGGFQGLNLADSQVGRLKEADEPVNRRLRGAFREEVCMFGKRGMDKKGGRLARGRKEEEHGRFRNWKL